MVETPIPDLNMPVETVCYIIMKAKEFDVKVQEDNLNEGSDTADDAERDILADYSGDLTLEQLRETIHDLNEDHQVILIALSWLGRGDFDISEWSDAMALADERHRGDSVNYLVGTPLLGDYLEEGLAAFGESCSEMAMGHL